MASLNQRAFDLLNAEIDRLAGSDPVQQVQKEIALRRLQKMRDRPGRPATLEELRDAVDDLFPDFSEKVLKRAAKANMPPSPVLGRLKWAGLTLAGLIGGVWFLNLPYPPIRYPVSRTIPIVLLPSFISMDHNYRQAIALTEQADQLVNSATSATDFELGTTKVKAAQKHLDALPVWFLGYYPSVYCGWFGCGWRFTLDEFQQARKGVARMDAKLFQEKNALDALEKADQTVVKAKQDYRTSNPTEKQGAIERWQQGMDTLQQVPPETLAGRQAKTKLIAYERDFEQATGSVAGASQTGDLVGAAQEFARIAQQSSMGETHTAAEWKEIQSQWQEAIERLEQVKPNEPGYPQAQKLLASYKSNLSKARIKEENELSSTEAYDRADTLRQQLLANVNRADSGYIASTLQQIRSELSKVKPGTTVYAEAQQLKSFADKRLKQYGLQ